LQAGFAIDGLGRHIIVPSDIDAEEVLFEGPEGTTVKELTVDDVVIFYLERDECRTGKVPSYGSPSPCAETCCYSRVRESYRVSGRVLNANDFNDVLEIIEDYYRKVDKDLLGIEGDAGVFDVLKLISRYADRNQPSVSGFLGKLRELCRVYEMNGRGGVAIWAARYGSFNGTIEKNEEYEELDGLDSYVLGNLFRRYILSNDTLAQMITEHATDYDNPHRTRESETIHGKYTITKAQAALGDDYSTWAEHDIAVGPLEHADGRPVEGTVTSVSVGFTLELAASDSFKGLMVDPEFGECLRENLGFFNGNDGAGKIALPFTLYGYYTELFNGRVLSGGDGPERFVTDVVAGGVSGGDVTGRPVTDDAGYRGRTGLLPLWVSIVPTVTYSDESERSTLYLHITETVSNMIFWINYIFKLIIYNIVKERCDNPDLGIHLSSRFMREYYNKYDFLDLDIIVYWSAAVTDVLDMEGPKKALTLLYPGVMKTAEPAGFEGIGVIEVTTVEREPAVTSADTEVALTEVPEAEVDVYNHLLYETDKFAGAARYLNARAVFLETAVALIDVTPADAGIDIPGMVGLTKNELIGYLEKSRGVSNRVSRVLRDIELAADYLVWNPSAKAADAEAENAVLEKATVEEVEAAVRVRDAQLKGIEKAATEEPDAPSGEVRSVLFNNLGIKETAEKDELATILSKGKKRLGDIKTKFGR
jgi:hypothetical protein